MQNLDPVEQGLWAPEWGYGELLMRATEDGTVEPWLLEDLAAESDTAWRLTPREGVTFHSGNPFDAAALTAPIETHVAENARVHSLLPQATATVEGSDVSLSGLANCEAGNFCAPSS